MKSSKVLEMLQQNRIEELKAELQDEIFTESLKVKPNAKKRYAAMKKYFTLADSAREICQKPCAIEFEGEKYNSFTNSYSLALTKEPCGEITMFDTSTGNYPDISRLVDLTGHEDKIDFNKVIAEAKSKGYKLKRVELMSNDYLMRYNGAYFRIALVDCTYGIIADGEKATVYHSGDKFGKLTIKNDIGICVVLPIRMDGKPAEWVTIIDAN